MAASSTFAKRCLQNSYCSILLKYTRAFPQQRLLFSTEKGKTPDETPVRVERDPFLVFINEKVQSLLSSITGFDIMKVAGPKIVPLEKPVYKLLTTEQLEQEQESAAQRMRQNLQMPPYMNPRKPPGAPLSIDPDLAHFDTSKFVFSDITFGLKDRERVVTVRDIDGNLRNAPWDVKERMNQIYNPREGRKVVTPAMFKEANLERMMKEKKYQYVLDRACCQFEPDDPDYVRSTRRVYSAVDSAQDYDTLWSTRHFGPMAFYLVWHHQVDGLLAHMLETEKLQDAADLVGLYTIVHPDSECAAAVSQLTETDQISTIKAYISTESKNKDRLELCVQALEDPHRLASSSQS